jgi:hypothetical protein
VPLITNGTTVMDFFFRNGPSALNTKDLKPGFVSASFPLVWRMPRRSSFLSIRLYVPSISASVPGSVKEILESLAIPPLAETLPFRFESTIDVSAFSMLGLPAGTLGEPIYRLLNFGVCEVAATNSESTIQVKPS